MPFNFARYGPCCRPGELECTIDFYSKFLGFRCDALNREYGWASLRRDSVELMVAAPFTGSLYFNVEDVSELWNSLKDVVNVCYPMEDFVYGMRKICDLRQ